jgi:hypothetical protein
LATVSDEEKKGFRIIDNRIKKQRQMAAQATAHIAPDDKLLTDANKPKHFNR